LIRKDKSNARSGFSDSVGIVSWEEGSATVIEESLESETKVSALWSDESGLSFLGGPFPSVETLDGVSLGDLAGLLAIFVGQNTGDNGMRE
jgi:hypothetical protein